MQKIELSFDMKHENIETYISIGSSTFLLGVLTPNTEGLLDISSLSTDLMNCAEQTNRILSKLTAEILRRKT